MKSEAAHLSGPDWHAARSRRWGPYRYLLPAGAPGGVPRQLTLTQQVTRQHIFSPQGANPGVSQRNSLSAGDLEPHLGLQPLSQGVHITLQVVWHGIAGHSLPQSLGQPLNDAWPLALNVHRLQASHCIRTQHARWQSGWRRRCWTVPSRMIELRHEEMQLCASDLHDVVA